MTTGHAPIEVTEATFGSAVLDASQAKPVIVDFWAPWCGPCRILGPILERVAAEFGDAVQVAKLNTDENRGIAMQYGIQGIPAVKAFKDRRVVGEFIGAQPEAQVRAFFRAIAPSQADRAVREAEEMAEGGDAAAAERRFRGLLASAPGNADAVFGLARLLIARGERQEAEELLKAAPTDRRAKALRHRIFLEGFADRHSGEDLEGEVAANPDDPRARYRWGVMLAAHERYEEALDELIESVRLDGQFADGAARQAALAVFDILGLDSPLAREYQRRLAAVIF